MRGQDNQAGDLPVEERRNGQSPERRRARGTVKSQVPRARTRSVVRRIDTGSVLKVSVIFYVAVYGILLVAAVLLWMAATATGLRDNIEKVIADLIASGKFHFVGTELLRGAAVGGAILVVLGTAANLMLAVLYNLISDLVGGVSFAVEERPVRRPRRQPAIEPAPRRQPAIEPTPTASAEPALRSGTEPAPRSGTQPGPAARTESTRILIPGVEAQRRASLPVAVAQPERPEPQVAATEPTTDANLEAFGL